MIYQDDFSLPTELLEQFDSEGLDCLPELVRILIKAATQIDRERYLGAGAEGLCKSSVNHWIGWSELLTPPSNKLITINPRR